MTPSATCVCSGPEPPHRITVRLDMLGKTVTGCGQESREREKLGDRETTKRGVQGQPSDKRRLVSYRREGGEGIIEGL